MSVPKQLLLFKYLLQTAQEKTYDGYGCFIAFTDLAIQLLQVCEAVYRTQLQVGRANIFSPRQTRVRNNNRYSVFVIELSSRLD